MNDLHAAPTLDEKISPGTVLAIVLVTYLMILLDISIVITGLPEIREGLHFSPVGLSWVQNAYLLCFGGFLLLGARAGDVLGRKRMLILGLALFTASSLAIGCAQSALWLICARAIQGIGAAILAPTVLSLISTTFAEGPERTKALAYYSMVAGAGASLGLVLGGVFAGELSWRVGFIMNVPLGIALMFAASRYLKESPRSAGAFDAFGAFASTLGMGALVYGIIRSAEAGWTETGTLLSIGLGVIVLALFVWNEARAPQPIMPLRLFASGERSGAYAARMLFLGAMVGFFFFTTLYMQEVLGFSPVQAGLGFLPMTVPTFAAAMMVQSFTRRLGNSGLMALSLVLLTAGMAWLSLAGVDASYLMDVGLPMIVIGLGNGFALAPLTNSGVAGVADRDQGAASGLVNAAHQLGGTLGLSVLVVVFAAADTPSMSGKELLAHRIGEATLGAGVMLGIALAIVFFVVLPAGGRRGSSPMRILQAAYFLAQPKVAALCRISSQNAKAEGERRPRNRP